MPVLDVVLDAVDERLGVVPHLVREGRAQQDDYAHGLLADFMIGVQRDHGEDIPQIGQERLDYQRHKRDQAVNKHDKE